MIRCFGCGLLVTRYLLLGAHVLWLFGRRRVNCRVVWGLDRWAVRVVGFGYWFFDGFGWRLAWIMLFLEISGWFVDELLFGWSDGLNRGSGVGRLWSVGLWRMMDLALVIGECDDVIQETEVIVWPSISWSGSGRGDRGWGVTEVTERLMMLYVELVVNLCRSSRAFSRNCCVFGIIVRFADWLIDFYLKWCGVWWLGRLFWIGNLNNVRGGCRSR